MHRHLKARKPVIWVLTGARLGDNLQALALADALGWPQKSITIEYNAAYRIPNFLLGKSLFSLKPKSAAAIQPPWPDLVISCGRRGVPVARWIKHKSGGHSKLVQLGRPRAALDAFDLVVTTPQYALPELDNVIHNLMPLSPPSKSENTTGYKIWLKRFEHLPRPWTGILVGGSTWPFKLDIAAATSLGHQLSDMVNDANGAALIAGSPRTPPASLDALSNAVSAPACCYKFGNLNENPYGAILALCDNFIVTGDSVSMIGEACKTGKPVYIFDIPRKTGITTAIAAAIGKARYKKGFIGNSIRRLAITGLFSPPRDIARFHKALIRANLAAPLGKKITRTIAAPDELDATKRRIEALFADHGE